MSEPSKSPIKVKPRPGQSREGERRKRFLLSFGVLGIVWLLHVHADPPFYRCVVNGKTTYADRPCDGRALPGGHGSNTPHKTTSNRGGPSKAIASNYTIPYGVWRGQAQYQASMRGQVIRDAHVVVPLVIQVEEQGRVRGFSAENGCTMLGVAAPYVTPMALMLDVSLSECRYPYFNRRYSGSLVLSQADSQVRLSLQSSNLGGASNGGDYFDLKATMRR